jgi:hypothetical protein
MHVVYTGEEMPSNFKKSIFLAGPCFSPGQGKELTTWRQKALKYLKDQDFDGVVFCPENRKVDFSDIIKYDDQIEWEDKYLNIADCILFWIPRDLSLDQQGELKLPAFTTNIEWGAWANSGKVVLGCPDTADKVDYIKHYAVKYNIPTSNSLEESIDFAVDKLQDGYERRDGERYVPLFIWNTESFQSWYNSQKKSGNRLDKAKVLFSFRPGYKNFVFLWILQCEIYIKSENRSKINEFVLSRTDISSIVMYYKCKDFYNIKDYEVVIVKEFRSPANTKDSFIYELPGGSSNSQYPDETVVEEVYEETGLRVDL